MESAASKIINNLVKKKQEAKNINCLWINKSTGQEQWLQIQQGHYDALVEANFPFIKGKLSRRKIIRVIADCDYPNGE